MPKASSGGNVQITAFMSNGRTYYLYVIEGKLSFIECWSAVGLERFYPDACNFNTELGIIIGFLCGLENLKSLKKLYNALEEGDLKKDIKGRIDKLINRYEEALSILKS